jgi:hypothetical protein
MWMAGLFLVSISIIAHSSFARPQKPDSSEIAVVKSGAGACTADFVVTDKSGKGVYDAKIRILIRYRFMGLHRLDASVATNYEGKARIEGLPEQIKGTAEFNITHQDQSKSLPYDPVTDCHPRFEVTLGGN